MYFNKTQLYVAYRSPDEETQLWDWPYFNFDGLFLASISDKRSSNSFSLSFRSFESIASLSEYERDLGGESETGNKNRFKIGQLVFYCSKVKQKKILDIRKQARSHGFTMGGGGVIRGSGEAEPPEAGDFSYFLKKIYFYAHLAVI